MSKAERDRTVARRLSGPSQGLGYWAARDAVFHTRSQSDGDGLPAMAGWTELAKDDIVGDDIVGDSLDIDEFLDEPEILSDIYKIIAGDL